MKRGYFREGVGMHLFIIMIFIFLYLFSFYILIHPYITTSISKYTAKDYDFERVKLVTNYVDGFSRDSDIGFLSEREQRHLWDVRERINDTKVISALVFVFFIIGYIGWEMCIGAFAKNFTLNNILSVYIKYVKYVLIGLPAAVLFLVLFFSSFFYFFHKLLFTNNLWLLPSDSVLIRLFSQNFFLVFFVLYNGLFLLVAWVLAKTGEKLYSLPRKR